MRFRLGILAFFSLLVASTTSAQNYPFPSSQPVVCATCVGEYKNLPTYPFSAPIRAHTGRIVDSQLVKDWQGGLPCGLRTLRGRGMKIDTVGDRVYVMMGSVLASYRLSNFFASTLKKPLANAGPFACRGMDPINEQYAPWDSMLYAEDGTQEWLTPTSDGQDRLFDYDFDDRGYVYAAYSAFGWGLVKENGSRFSLIKQFAHHLDQTAGVLPKLIMAVKSGERYYALVTIPQGDKVAIWDTTNATSGGITYVRTVNASVFAWARDANGDIGIAGTDRSISIYSASDFISGLPPKATFGAQVNDIASDGIAFWASSFTDASQGPMIVYQMSQNSQGGYNLVAHATGLRFTPRGIEATGSFVTVPGFDNQNSPNAKLFRVTPNGLVEIPLGNYLSYYYAHPPAGYARPGGYTASVETVMAYTHQGKDYLFYLAEGLADVYELQTRDAVDIDVDASASRGTPNANTPNPTDGPFVGDLLTFRSSTTQGSVKRIRWDFANPESGTSNNTSDVDTGVAVQHRYVNLLNSTAIASPKNVSAAEVSDSTNNDSVVVNLKVPSPRVKVKGTSYLITSNTAQNAVPIVVSDKFLDASDGTLEGHYSSWQLGTATPVLTAPTVESDVGGTCGAQTLAFTANYAPYTGSGTSVTPTTGFTPYAASVNYSYTVRPFVPSIQLTTTSPTATDLVFQNTTRVADFSTTTHFAKGGATPVRIQWSVTTASGTTNAPLRTTTLASVATDQYTIAKSAITVGSKVTMTLTIVDSADVVATTCRTTSFTTGSAEMMLNPPDPEVVTVSGCLYTNGPCSLTLRSISGASRSGWSYQWSVDGFAVNGAVGETFSPVFTTAGNHAVRVTATNVIGNTTSAPVTFAITTPPCAGAPTSITFSYSGTVSGCLANCPPGEPIRFSPRSFGYGFQECDTFRWEVLNDGRTFTEKEPLISFSQNGAYTVKLTVTNTSGAASVSNTVQIGTVIVERCDPPPSRVNIVYSGSPGCQVGGTCYEGDSIQFTVINGTLGNYDFTRCPDSFAWDFGNGVSAEMSPRRTFTQGTYTINVRVTNSGGSTTAVPVTLVVLPTTPVPTCPLPPSSYVSISWSAPSGCALGGVSCRYGETITFTANAFLPGGFKGCEAITWNFGDGSQGSGRVATHTYAQSATAKYPVTLTVRNDSGEQIQKTVEMNLAGAPIAVPTDVRIVSITPTPVAGTSLTFVGAATSAEPITSWQWNFGDGTTGSGQSATHTYDNPGDYRVELVARNAGGPSAPYSTTIKVQPKNQFAFLLPVVAHLTGNLGSEWRTDLQIFNPDPAFVPESPLELTLEFRGNSQVTKPIQVDSATMIVEDLYRRFFPTGTGAGTVIVRGNAPFEPQMWTRTYNQAASGVGTFGQLIPAIRLTDYPNAVTNPPAYILSGLQNSARFRTNLGLVNPTNAIQTVSVEAFDDSPFGFTIGKFDVDVNPYSLVQIGDLSAPSRIPAIANGKPYSLKLKTATGGALVGYASMIDNASGDPVFLEAIQDDAMKGDDFKSQVLPGMGRIGSWRSDVTIFNADTKSILLDLAYYDGTGAKVAEAKSVPLAANAFTQIHDLLKSTIWSTSIPDSIGVLHIDTATPGVVRYPVIFGRTYNDQGDKGTFGQGIPAFAASRPNVKLNAPGIIPGVRSDANYRTNIGLTNLSSQQSVVRVTLLDQRTGRDIGQTTFTLAGNQSGIGTDVIRALHATESRGTLKVEVVSGGPVWAFASIVDKLTQDPEYVPAIAATDD